VGRSHAQASSSLLTAVPVGRHGDARVVAPAAPISPGEALDSTMDAMYTYIVDRTQIYLTPEESAALERASIATGKTKSQLIREAIDATYRASPSLEEFIAGVDAAFGAWKEEPGEDRSAYLKDLRRADLAKQRYLERLRRAGAGGDR
jgi:predicted DNA-binding protein